MNPIEATVRGVLAGDPLLAAAADPDARAEVEPPVALVIGPRTTEQGARMLEGVALIREGHLVHGFGGDILKTPDPDLAILAGDLLYAEGLVRVAATGDLEAVTMLSRLIVDCAASKAAGNAPEAELAWTRTCAQIGGND